VAAFKMSNKFSRFTSNLADITKEIDYVELDRRRSAAKYVVKTIRKNIKSKGRSTPGGFPARRTGRLSRKISYALRKEDLSAIIGGKDQKTHLLEFGHGDGKERNKRPFLFPSFKEATPEVIRIMSERYF